MDWRAVPCFLWRWIASSARRDERLLTGNRDRECGDEGRTTRAGMLVRLHRLAPPSIKQRGRCGHGSGLGRFLVTGNSHQRRDRKRGMRPRQRDHVHQCFWTATGISRHTFFEGCWWCGALSHNRLCSEIICYGWIYPASGWLARRFSPLRLFPCAWSSQPVSRGLLLRLRALWYRLDMTHRDLPHLFWRVLYVWLCSVRPRIFSRSLVGSTADLSQNGASRLSRVAFGVVQKMSRGRAMCLFGAGREISHSRNSRLSKTILADPLL